MNTSSKTPEKPAKKTASAPKYLRVIGVALVLVLLALVGYLMTHRARQSCQLRSSDSALCLRLEQVSSPADLEKGLSGRDSLDQNTALLFRFDRDGAWCFWMKDMAFPIDILWLNNNKQVVHIETNVQPNSYPKRYCPPENARYVIEVNAGIAERARIVKGSQLQF